MDVDVDVNVHRSRGILDDAPAMDNSSAGLVTAAMARVKTGLVVYLVGLEQQNWLSTFGQFLGPVTKR